MEHRILGRDDGRNVVQFADGSIQKLTDEALAELSGAGKAPKTEKAPEEKSPKQEKTSEDKAPKGNKAVESPKEGAELSGAGKAPKTETPGS